MSYQSHFEQYLESLSFRERNCVKRQMRVYRWQLNLTQWLYKHFPPYRWYIDLTWDR